MLGLRRRSRGVVKRAAGCVQASQLFADATQAPQGVCKIDLRVDLRVAAGFCPGGTRDEGAVSGGRSSGCPSRDGLSRSRALVFVASLIRVVLDRPTPTVASLRGRVDGLWRRWAGNPIWAAAAAGPAGPAGAAGPGGAGGDSRCEDVHRVRLGGENPQVPLKSNLRFQWNLRTVGVSHHDTPMPVDNLRNFNGNRGRVRTCQDPQPGRSLFRAETCEPDMALAPTERRSRRYRNGPRPGQPATRLGNLPPAWATCHPPGQPATRLGNLPPAWATCHPPGQPAAHLPARNYLNRIGQPCTRPARRPLLRVQ